MAIADGRDGWVRVNEVRGPQETVYGVLTHYIEAGQGEPVILLHGGGAGASGEHGWFNAVPVLAKHYRVYALDQIGYGYTDKPLIDYSYQTLVNHLAGFIDALHLKDVSLVGNSMGAYVALKYTCDFPDRVRQVVTISSSIITRSMGIQTTGDGLPTFDGTEGSLRRFLGAIVNDPSKVSDDLIKSRYRISQLPGAREAKQSLQRYWVAVNDELNPSQQQIFDIRHRAPKLRVPWCVIWGDSDHTAPMNLADELRARAPNIASFHVVADAGHQVQNEQPEVCNRLILEFLASHMPSHPDELPATVAHQNAGTGHLEAREK